MVRSEFNLKMDSLVASSDDDVVSTVNGQAARAVQNVL